MLIKRPVQAKGPAKHEVFAEFSSAQMSADVALKTQQFEQTQDGEAALAKEEMAKAKKEQVVFESKQKLMQTELESKQKEHAKLHAKLASCQAELASVQRGLHAKEEQMSSQRSREQASD